MDVGGDVGCDPVTRGAQSTCISRAATLAGSIDHAIIASFLSLPGTDFMTKLQTEDIIRRKMMGYRFLEKKMIAVSSVHPIAFPADQVLEVNGVYLRFSGLQLEM